MPRTKVGHFNPIPDVSFSVDHVSSIAEASVIVNDDHRNDVTVHENAHNAPAIPFEEIRRVCESNGDVSEIDLRPEAFRTHRVKSWPSVNRIGM